ncbi:hypothetical protein BCV69DRAFT_191493 [Microstroma glucosiphilum]|uniref:Uncharacterized protein n=1 Tax=Pseudomicrostroma glucosiphilum TaxID=1684307 RepID=A0A316U6S0_9BASI|nr:hypothetical protein BCV69DRAFT_191493 [Pseudomicrostroma glucosiphilum]PWN20524.1 hypothetical protein BCV69DRAFT_191493 [Pseudomicrostroma glucosiphilum]
MRLHLSTGVSVLLLFLVAADALTSGSSTVVKRGWRRYLPFAARRPRAPTPLSSWDTTSSSHQSSPEPPVRVASPVLSPSESPSPPRGRSPTSPLVLSPPRRAPSPSGRVDPPIGFDQISIPHSFRSRSSSSTSTSTPPRSTWHHGESSTTPNTKRKGLWASLKDRLGGKRRKRE